MDKQKKYNSKYSRQEPAWEDEAWEEDSWQTGSTKPPKSRGGLMALLLILIIFLCGIVTVLGILNVRLFAQLQLQEEASLSIAFTEPQDQEELPLPTQEFTEVPHSGETSSPIAIQDSPQSVQNIQQENGLPLQEIYEMNIGSVVSISCQHSGGSSTGTGVILTDTGYIVTNAHVVEDALSVAVRLTDDRSFQANLVGRDEITDLAVLSIEAEDLIPAQFGDSNMLRVGDSVAAIGDPLGVEFRGTFTDGIVSAINRDVTVDGRTMTLIQTNAALNSGNSGGPLINCYGQVIGINTMKIGAFTDSAGVEGLGFAIPSATVKDIVDQIIDQGYVSGRPTLCIQGEALSTFYQHFYRLPAGLYITSVDSRSYAAYYGIQPGDILLYVDDTRIYSMDDLNAVLYTHQVGDVVSVTIYRSGQQATVDLKLTENRK